MSAFGRNANLAGGFAGRRGLVVFLFGLTPLLVDYCKPLLLLSGPSLRQHRPHRRKKKISTADLVVFCWAWPLFVVGSAFVCFRTKRKSGWGICGSSFVGPCCLCLVVSAFRGFLHVHGHSAMYFSCFYHFYFCQDRASGNIGRTRGKKKILRFEVQKRVPSLS